MEGEYVGYDGDLPRIPLLTTKSISWKNIVVEMLWFLSGQPDIAILQRHNCKFWDAWADDDGMVPMAYGQQWRAFPVQKEDGTFGTNDQLQFVVDSLKTNPMSRRMVVSAWNPEQAQTAALPPCHMLFAFNVQNVENEDGTLEQRLCLHLTQRSCDLALGVPYNIASYGLLLLIMSHITGIKPGVFAYTLLDLHIYTSKEDGSYAEHDHMEGLEEQLNRPLKTLPALNIDDCIKSLEDIEDLMELGTSTDTILNVFKLIDYNPHPAIKFKVATL